VWNTDKVFLDRLSEEVAEILRAESPTQPK